MTRQVICYFLFSIFFLVNESEGGISQSQSIDRTEMAYEERANFEIAIRWDGSPIKYRFDKPLRLDADKLKVTKFSSSIRSIGTGDDEITIKLFKYTLAPTSSGRGELLAVTIDYISWPDSIVGYLSTDPIEMVIALPKPKSKQDGLEDDNSTALVITLLFLLLLLGGSGYFIYANRKKEDVTLSNDDRFLAELTNIKKTSGTDMKTFQTGLYKSLVRYLESEHKISLSGKPLDEILFEIEKIEITRNMKDSFSNWLSRAEKEKFSPLASSPGEVIRLESEVRQFFEKEK